MVATASGYLLVIRWVELPMELVLTSYKQNTRYFMEVGRRNGEELVLGT